MKFLRGNFASTYKIIFQDKLCLGQLSEMSLLSNRAVWQANFLVVCIIIIIYIFFNGELGTSIDFYSFAS